MNSNVSFGRDIPFNPPCVMKQDDMSENGGSAVKRLRFTCPPEAGSAHFVSKDEQTRWKLELGDATRDYSSATSDALDLNPERQVCFLRAFDQKVRETPFSQRLRSCTNELDEKSLSLVFLQRIRYQVTVCREEHRYTVHATGFTPQWGCPRFVRKYGADRFLHVKAEGRLGYHSLHDCRNQLKPFYWLGRKWVCVRSKTDKLNKKKTCDGQLAIYHGHIFFAERACSRDEESCCQNMFKPTGQLPGIESMKEISALNVLRSHVPECVCSSCPHGCDQHFLCREGRLAFPERTLLQQGKYVKRIDMGWTDAEATVVLEASNIKEQEDFRSDKHPSEVLTDGNGLIGSGLAKRVSEMLKLDYVPAVFQGRLGCAKGTLTVHMLIDDNKVVLSRKMCKWMVDWAGCGVEDRCLEIKSYSKPDPVPQSLNQQYIAVCSAKGVPEHVFVDLAQQHIESLAEETLNESCLGHGLPGFKEAEEGKAKLALTMIDAGIGVSEPICMKWVLNYLIAQVKRIRNEAHYRCPNCWHAFIVPDWERKLLPHECMFRTGAGHFLEGWVSLARSPCTAPWDVQVYRALGQREVFQRFGATTPPYLIDGVIVLSAHPSCSYSPATFLAGGDFDGDKAMLNAHTPIVSALRHDSYDSELVTSLQKAYGKESKGGTDRQPLDPLEAIAHSHYLDMKGGYLVGQLGNLWAFGCDEAEAGASDRGVLQVGLLFQEALDGKLSADTDINKICVELGLTTCKPQPPHWHEVALKHLGDRQILSSKARRSTSTLGVLFDRVDVSRLLEKWRYQYGPQHYKYDDVQKNGVSPHPRLALTPDSQSFLQDAQDLLENYFGWRSREMDQKEGTKTPVSQLFSRLHAQLYADNPNFTVKKNRAIALYHAQIERFNIRVREGRQRLTAEAIEFHLEPAWRVCTLELCAYAARNSQDAVCCVSEEMRSKMRYMKLSTKPFEWLNMLQQKHDVNQHQHPHVGGA